LANCTSSRCVGRLSISIHLFLVGELTPPPLQNNREEGHFEVTKYLLKHKAQPSVTDKNGWTPLQFAMNFIFSSSFWLTFFLLFFFSLSRFGWV
jgi:ankyrin repeat protein